MKKIREDLWQTTFRTSEGINNAGYLLLRTDGNVLFYQAPERDSFDQIEALGGIKYQILSHRHDIDPYSAGVRREFGAILCCDEVEHRAFKEPRVDVVFSTNDSSLEDILILHTGGHTAGGISCVFDSPSGETYLFSGDVMIPVNDSWISQIVPEHGGNASRLAASLLLIADQRPSLVLSSASVGDTAVVEIDPGGWKTLVEHTASRPPIGT